MSVADSRSGTSATKWRCTRSWCRGGRGPARRCLRRGRPRPGRRGTSAWRPACGRTPARVPVGVRREPTTPRRSPGNLWATWVTVLASAGPATAPADGGQGGHSWEPERATRKMPPATATGSGRRRTHEPAGALFPVRQHLAGEVRAGSAQDFDRHLRDPSSRRGRASSARSSPVGPPPRPIRRHRTSSSGAGRTRDFQIVGHRFIPLTGQLHRPASELQRLACRHPGLPSKAIFGSEQVSGKPGQAPTAFPWSEPTSRPPTSSR